MIFLGACNAQKSEKNFVVFGEDKFATIINGNPKQVAYFTYKPEILNDGTIKKGGFLMGPGHLIGIGHKYVFDEEGRVLESYNYSDGDSIATSGRFWEFSQDNKVKFELRNGPPPYPKTGSRAANDFMIDSLSGNNRKLFTKEYWRIYDEYLDTIMTVLSQERRFTYDQNGVLIKENIDNYDFDNPSTLSSSYKVHLDKTDVINYHTEYRDGKLYRYGKEEPYFVYTYDEDGNKVKEEIEKYGYYTEYYPNGIVKKMYYGEDSYQEQNEEGYIIKSVLDSNTTYEVQYDQFDEYDNWTRVIVYKNGTPTEYGERKIVYY